MFIYSHLRQREIGNSSVNPGYARSLAANDAFCLKKCLWLNLCPKVHHKQGAKFLKQSYTNFKGIFGLKYSNDG